MCIRDRAGAPHPLLHSVEQPTLEVAKALLRYPGIRLNVVTGGPGVVREALDAGKKAVIAVSLIADRLKEAFARSGAIVLPPHQIEQLRKVVLEQERGPRK